MEINKKDLKKTSRKFRQLASRTLNAHYNEVNSIIRMFVEYIDDTPIIIEYIQSIIAEYPNLQDEIDQVSKSYGHLVLSTGDTTEQEISSIYQILKFISENSSVQTFALGWGYTSSKKYQDMVKEFGNRVIMPFVDGINVYLSDIATDMGYDEESRFMINVSGGQAQVNISNDNSTLNATQNIQINKSEIDSVISELKSNLEAELTDNEILKNLLISQIQLIESEAVESKPKKEVLKTAISAIQTLLQTVPLALTAAESGNKLYELIAPLFN
ncbi:hypothetical protein P7D68_15855 [Enterococcus avium]|uniref:hypothetical protein n=1 Tax=Enterococcus avium TaxID=33945 RepID=UPI00288D9E1F|nr:hypothetical protein [Enterococcus avium]MDT2471677.1 hypothetical protein [Enterococcus avium]